jgi:hypothetical protein
MKLFPVSTTYFPKSRSAALTLKMSVTEKIAGNRLYNIASIPGDGIGIEVIEQTIRVLRKLEEILQTFSLHFEDIDWSSERYKKLGEYIPRGGLETLKRYDAILFGAVGSPGMFFGNQVCSTNLNYDRGNSLTFKPEGDSANMIFQILDVPDHISLWGLILPIRKVVCELSLP